MESGKNDLIKLIKRYQNAIQQLIESDSNSQKVSHYLCKLAKLPIRLEELEQTGIGKTVNSLRKWTGPPGEEATLLVARWKAAVKEQFEAQARSDADEARSSAEEVEPNQSENSSPDSSKQKHNKYSESKTKSTKRSGDEIRPESTKRLKDDSPRTEKRLSDVPAEFENMESQNVSVVIDGMKNGNVTSKTHKSHHSHEKEKSSSHSSSKSSSKHKEREKSKHRKKVETEPDSRPHSKGNSEKGSEPKSDSNRKHKDESKSKDHKDHSRHKNETKNGDSSKLELKPTDNAKGESKSSKESSRHKSQSKNTDEAKHKERSLEKESRRKDDKHRHHKNPSSEKSQSTKTEKCGEKVDKNQREKIVVKQEPVRNYPSEEDDNTFFGAALMGISEASSTTPKKPVPHSSSVQASPNLRTTPRSTDESFDLSPDNVPLEPMQLDDERTDYASPSTSFASRTGVKVSPITDEDALASIMTTKNQRTKVYSGNKNKGGRVSTLLEMSARILTDNFDAIEYTGGVPYYVLKPILEKVSAEQLFKFEDHNPYLISETDELWEFHVRKEFRNAERQELEAWRELYLRCVEEREDKLQSLTKNITMSIANSVPDRRTKLAYVDSYVKPPRNVARSQAKHGTGSPAVKKSRVSPKPNPVAIQSLKERLAKEARADPSAVSVPAAKVRTFQMKKKDAPLMQKTKSMFRSLKR